VVDMLDLRRIRQDADIIRQALTNKGSEVSLDEIIDLDSRLRKATHNLDQLRAEKNSLTSVLAKGGLPAEEIARRREEIKTHNAGIKDAEAVLKTQRKELESLLLWIPNIPHCSVPIGLGPNDNTIVRSWGEKPSFTFDSVPHWEIASVLGILDQKRAAKITGSNFPLFVGEGAQLVRGLISFMLDLHTTEHGYTEYWPPYLANRRSMLGTGQLPKLEDDMYVCRDPELFLTPTGEVPLTNIFRDEILMPDQVPMKMTAYTPCFRREAGAYGKDTRGLNRVHQFDKVELVRITEPARSYDELESLTTDVEEVLQRLELPYRVLNLCTRELGFAAAKCYDLEVWSAGQERWLEVSSCSNFEDFQSRRASIRYRSAIGEKPIFPHTLNGSGVALPRLVAALLENGQTREGFVSIPESLQSYLGGRKVLGDAP